MCCVLCTVCCVLDVEDYVATHLHADEGEED